MPPPQFFDQFGIVTVADVLSESDRRAIRESMDSVPAFEGGIWNADKGLHLSPDVKKRKEFELTDPQILELVSDSLFSLIPQLSRHFALEIVSIQPPKFTRYDEGDYYQLHRDVSPSRDGPVTIEERKIAITIFLNEEGGEEVEGDYQGGNLTFYGLMDQHPWHGVGLPLESEPGMLVAFRPDIMHEVTPVTGGSRYAITTWYT